jgi:signal transduction histidine kinase
VSFGTWSRSIRSTWERPIVRDTLLATILTATSLIGVVTELRVDLPEGAGDEASRPLDALGVGLVLCQTVPLVWRRKAPLIVLAVSSAALFLFFGLGYLPSFASIGFLVALYTVAAYRERPVSVLAGLFGGIVILLILLIGKEPVDPDTVIVECLIVGAAWSLGDGFRIRRRQVVQLEDRATQLERQQEALAERAVAEERRVIARELHDVVAHNVSVIVAQSGAAQRISRTHPDEAFATLGAIERTGRAALVEMRRLTGFLRTVDDGSTHTPQPGLSDLSALVERVRDAGLPVILEVKGSVRILPAGLDLSAYRIVQEALTNALKHAGPARATVTVLYEATQVLLTIQDDGAGAHQGRRSESRVRYGHLGMRERVALFGGWLGTEAIPTGGYRVTACLPFDEEP